MKTTLNILLLLFFTAALTTTAHAQQKVLAMAVETSSNDTTPEGLPVIDENTLIHAVMNVNLDNTDSIYKLHVKLGRTQGGTEFISAVFDYNVSGTFGSTTYSQTGSTILLGLGAYAGMIHYYAEVQIEKTDHSYEDAVTFSR